MLTISTNSETKYNVKADHSTITQSLKNMSERLNIKPHFDVLGDILETLRFQGTIFFRSTLAAPWGMSLDATKFPRFHIAMTGNFFICSEITENTIEVLEMGMVILPTGDAHWIADRPGRQMIPSTKAGEACELGKPMFQQGQITNNLMCGLIRFDNQTTHPFLNALPNVIHVPHIEISSAVWRLIMLIDNELSESSPSSNTMVDRLTEALFIKLLQKRGRLG